MTYRNVETRMNAQGYKMMYRRVREDQHGCMRHEMFVLGLDGVLGMEEEFEYNMHTFWNAVEEGSAKVRPVLVHEISVEGDFELMEDGSLEMWFGISGRVFDSLIAKDRFERAMYANQLQGYEAAMRRLGRGFKPFDGRNFGVL